MRTWLKNLYKKHLNSYHIQVLIPSALASGTFVLGILKDLLYLEFLIPAGILLILLATGNGYLHRILSKEESDDKRKEIDSLKERTETAEKDKDKVEYKHNLLTHLIDVTNRLVNLKRAEFSRTALSPQQKFDYCINLILSMLCEFYEIHSRAIEFRVVLFIPAQNSTHLIPYFCYNHRQVKPWSMGQTPAKIQQLFSYGSPQKVCLAWRTRSIVIVEDTDKEPFNYNHPGQERNLKSMLAYPIISPEDSSVTGVISIVANKPGFFQKDEEDYHRFIIEHFAARVNYEKSVYMRSGATNWLGVR